MTDIERTYPRFTIRPCRFSLSIWLACHQYDLWCVGVVVALVVATIWGDA